MLKWVDYESCVRKVDGSCGMLGGSGGECGGLGLVRGWSCGLWSMDGWLASVTVAVLGWGLLGGLWGLFVVLLWLSFPWRFRWVGLSALERVL